MKKLTFILVILFAVNTYAFDCKLKAWPRNDLGSFSFFPTKATYDVESLDACIEQANIMVQQEWTQLYCDQKLDCFDLNYYYKNVHYTFTGVEGQEKGKVKK